MSAETEITFTAGASTPGQDITLHREQPHALVEGGPFTFVLTEGRTASDAIVISNPEGHAELTFDRATDNNGHHEIAAMTGVAGGTVKSQLHRARRLLREALNA